MSVDRRRLRDLASVQHGVVASFQSRSMGSAGSVRKEFESPRWTPLHRGVFVVAGAPITADARVMGRLLRAGPGASIHGGSGLALWNLPGFSVDPLHICRMRGSNGKELRGEGIIVHTSRRMPVAHVVELRGFAVATPSRALADISAVTHPARLERLIDRAWSRNIASYASLMQVVDDLTKKGRRGIPTLRALVGVRGPDYVPPESGLESRVNQLLIKEGYPEVVRQANVAADEWLARVDFRIGTTPVLIEVQSDLYHASLSAGRDDAGRIARLEAAGFIVVQVFEDEVWYRPQDFLARIRSATVKRT